MLGSMERPTDFDEVGLLQITRPSSPALRPARPRLWPRARHRACAAGTKPASQCPNPSASVELLARPRPLLPVWHRACAAGTSMACRSSPSASLEPRQRIRRPGRRRACAAGTKPASQCPNPSASVELLARPRPLLPVRHRACAAGTSMVCRSSPSASPGLRPRLRRLGRPLACHARATLRQLALHLAFCQYSRGLSVLKGATYYYLEPRGRLVHRREGARPPRGLPARRAG